MKRRTLYSFLCLVGACILFYIIYYLLSLNQIHERKEFCRVVSFHCGEDSTFVIRPFYSIEYKKYAVVFPANWGNESIRCNYNNTTRQLFWKGDSVITIQGVGGGMLCFRTKVNCFFINTVSGTMDAIDGSEDKKVRESGCIKVETPEGEIDYKGNFKSIKGRGNSTWRNREKKPYNLNFKDSVSLLQMQEAKKYCLLSNNLDRTNIKNYIAYRFAKEIDLPCSVDERYVSLFLNGVYNGLYLITTDIENGFTEDNGIYLLERIRSNDSLKTPSFLTKHGERIRIKRPSKITDKRNKSLQDIYEDFEDEMISPQTSEKVKIDFESFAKNYILQELFVSTDNDFGNFYMLLDLDNNDNEHVLRAATIWDYDNSMGNTSQPSNEICNAYSNTYFYRRGIEYESGFFGIFGELCKKDAFNKYVDSLIIKMEPSFRNYFSSMCFKTLTLQTEYENKLDIARWKNKQSNDLNAVKRFIIGRLDFLKNNAIESRNYFRILAKCKLPGERYTRLYEFRASKNSMFIPPVLNSMKFRGWSNINGDDVSDSLYVFSDTTIISKWLYVPEWFKLNRKTIRENIERLITDN